MRVIMTIGTAVAVATASGSSAYAQSRPTPPNWQYEIVGGKRVPWSPNHNTKPKSSKHKKKRLGKCGTIMERSATGEYKETRQCDGSGNGAPSA